MRFDKKDILLLIPATLLAIAGLGPDDPWVVGPCLFLSWATFIVICVIHEGSRRTRMIVGAVITVVLLGVGYRRFNSIYHFSAETASTRTLVGEIEQLQLVEVEQSGKKWMSVYLIVAVRNSGEPTIADNYKMRVETVDGRIFSITPTLLPTTPMVDLRNNTEYRFQPGDGIQDKTAVTPIPKGSKVVGWLRGDIGELTAKDFARPGAIFTVSFLDVDRHEYAAIVRQGHPFAQSEAQQYHPGAAPRFIPTPRKKE
jgi:hypothetical protein